MPGGKGKRADLTGQRFGRLVAVRVVEVEHGDVWWICDCDCGVRGHKVRARNLHGGTKSCGCARSMRWRLQVRDRRARSGRRGVQRQFPFAGYDDDIGEFLEG